MTPSAQQALVRRRLGDTAPASRPALPAAGATLWIIPATIVLTALFFTFWAWMSDQLTAYASLLTAYLSWAIATFVAVVTFPPKPVQSLESPIRKALVAFIATFLLTNLLVYASGLRTDVDKLLPQIAALTFMTLPFFLMHAGATRANAAPAILLTCHVIALLSVVSVLADFTGLAPYEYHSGRYFGFLGDGVAWALTLPLLVYFCSRRLVLAAACLLVLGLTGSRAPALCVLAAFVLLIAFSRGRRFQYVVLLLLMGAIAAYQSDVFATLLERLSGTEFTANDRLSNAALGLRVFDMSPLFGSGYNAQAYYFPETERRFDLGQFSIQTSSFVQMLAEGGLMLFAAYMAFVITVTLGGIALLKRPRADSDWGVITGTIVWLLSMLWVNQSAAWFLVSSYLGALMFGMAGVVSGYYARLRFARRPAVPMARKPI